MNVPVHIAGETHAVPPPPQSVSETGLTETFLLDLLIKTIFRHGMERPSRLAAEMRVAGRIVDQLLEKGKEKQLIFMLGQRGANLTSEMRYQLTQKGREWALQAMSQNSWTGPAPVPIETFCEQITAQSIRLEPLREERLGQVFKDMILPVELMELIGPAVNSGASMLFYGPPGNGKSTIARGICNAFQQQIYVPHALSISGDVVVFFDPAVHKPVPTEEGQSGALRHATMHDPRYVPCLRPFVITGGELTLEKFDLARNAATGLYEAPLQFKAVGGLFVVDDFGRQRETPQQFINRLIVPLEERVDHLVMDNGRKVEVPFDSLVIFATNYEPRTLVDEAGLRRLRHKILVDRPDRMSFVKILIRTAAGAGLTVNEDVLAYILFDLYGSTAGTRFNAFHPRFLIDQCVSICAYQGTPAELTPKVLNQAWDNLVAAH